MLEDDARLFNCQCCGRQLRVCRRCDRGQRYCSPQCRGAGRRQSQREANARYQDTRRGARHHAARQARWRERQKHKVTYHGFRTPHRAEKVGPVLLSETEDVHSSQKVRKPVRCDFCHRLLGRFLRFWPLHRRGWG